MDKAIIRRAKNKENPYAQISNAVLRDTRLTWRATGLLSYLLSLPDNWQLNLIDLTARKQDGRASTRSTLKELITLGYVIKTRLRNKAGHFTQYEYLVYEIAAPSLKVVAFKPKRQRVRAPAEFEEDRRSPDSTPAEENCKRIQEIRL